MQDRPTAAEAVEAVSEFLSGDAGGGAAASPFQLKVAANLLAIVARELRLGPAFEREERARLRSLLGRDGELAGLNRELAEAIRAGALDDRSPELLEHLRRTGRERLEVANPRYLDI